MLKCDFKEHFKNGNACTILYKYVEQMYKSKLIIKISILGKVTCGQLLKAKTLFQAGISSLINLNKL